MPSGPFTVGSHVDAFMRSTAPAAARAAIGSDLRRFDVADDTARFALAAAEDAPRLGDLVRQGEATPYLFFLVADATALGSEAGYAPFGGAVALPPARTGLATSDVSDEGATLSWTNPASDVTVTGIRVSYRLGTAGAWLTAATLAAGATSYAFTGFAASSSYQLRVQALSANGPSPSANATINTLAGWTPANFASPVLWLESDSGVSVDGANRVTSWQDKSANDMDAVPTATSFHYNSTPPTKTAPALIGGKITFAGDENLGFTKPLLPFTPGFGYTGPGVIARVARITSWPNPSWNVGIFGPDLDTPQSLFGSKVLLPGELTGVTYGYLSASWKEGIWKPSAGATLISLARRRSDGSTSLTCVVVFNGEGNVPRFWYRFTGTPGTQHFPANWFPYGTNFTALTWGGASPAPGVQLESLVAATDDVTDTVFAKIERYLIDKWSITPAPLVLCVGDSLTKGYTNPNNEVYPVYLSTALGASADVANVGINSRTVAQITADEPAYASILRPRARNIAVVWVGTNSIEGTPGEAATTDAATIHTGLAAVCANFRSRGWKVVVLDCIARSWSSDAPAKNAVRTAFNTAVAANWSTYADAFVQVSADTRLQTPTNFTYFTDGTHLTAAGYQVVSGLVAPAVSALLA